MLRNFVAGRRNGSGSVNIKMHLSVYLLTEHRVHVIKNFIYFIVVIMHLSFFQIKKYSHSILVQHYSSLLLGQGLQVIF